MAWTRAGRVGREQWAERVGGTADKTPAHSWWGVNLESEGQASAKSEARACKTERKSGLGRKTLAAVLDLSSLQPFCDIK